MKNGPMNAEKARKMGRFVQAAQRAIQSGGEKPFVLQHQITHHCNCTCESCLWRDNSLKELNTEEIKRIYSEARDEGFISLFVWGGEPLMRKDYAEVLEHAKINCDFINTMVTNGYFLPERIDSFAEYIDAIVVSIDSTNPEKHDEMRGVKGIYDKAVEGVNIVKEKYPQVSIQLNCCIQAGMKDELDDFVALSDELDVPISFSTINTGRHVSGTGLKDMVSHLEMSPDDMTTAFSKLLDAKQSGHKVFNSNMYLNHFIDGVKKYNCHFQKVFVVLKGNGDLEDCLQIDVPIANLRDMSFKDALSLPRYKELRKVAEKCHSCNSATMVDCSYIWEDPSLLMQEGGLSFG